jgi:hypothetical protein
MPKKQASKEITIRSSAAELIYQRADAGREHMGLSTWKDAPHGKIIKSGVVIDKNYLTQDEMEALGVAKTSTGRKKESPDA